MIAEKDVRTTSIRQRMIDQMRMAGLARNTQASYVREIKCLAKAFSISPDRLEPEQVRSWHLARIDLGLSESTTNVGLAALKFFYEDTLHQPWMIDGLRRAMSEEEIERLLMATPDLRYRTSMTLTYACGLRISETVAVTIDDVKSKEGLLHVRSGTRPGPRCPRGRAIPEHRRPCRPTFTPGRKFGVFSARLKPPAPVQGSWPAIPSGP